MGVQMENQRYHKLATIAMERLAKPKMAASFADWRRDWAEEEVCFQPASRASELRAAVAHDFVSAAPMK